MTDSQDETVVTTLEKPRPPALNILSELSIGTYVSYSRALKELLSNSWDAGANKVQIKIAADLNEISILDDGIGMSEADIRERFLRLGGSSSARGAVQRGRRLIGHKGIGALSVMPICREVRVLSTRENSSERVEASLDISKVIEKAKQQEDLDTHYVYTLNKWDNEPLDTHYTFISLHNLTADIKEFLEQKGVTTKEYITTVAELSGLDQLKWELAMVSPVGYLKEGPFTEKLEPMISIKRELEKANFAVFLNNEQLLKPISLPSADIKFTEEYKRGIDYEIYPLDHTDAELEFHGYIFSQATAIMPSELRGSIIRLNNVAIGSYDINWMKYQKSVGPRLGLTTGEIYVYKGLDDALLIDRDRFRETDANYKRFRALVHAKVKESFGGATSRSRTRSTIQKEKEAKTFRQKMEAKASQYLSRAPREKGIRLELDELANKPPFILDKRQGRLVLNSAHQIFKKLKSGEREIVQAFLLAIGIGRERSAGDVNRMFDEIIKIVTDLLGSRLKD